jgi:A/G-specific adenine glycosylase
VSPSASDLLHWYDRHRRHMPWRCLPGEPPDLYRVWLSEIMLQQTTVAAVIPYFIRFLERFPSISHLAAAEEGTVMAAWAGLGYYARARNLHACAKRVTELGGFPRTVEGLRTLPGVGAYTAAAVAAIAFGLPVVPIDGNVERVAARLFAIGTPLPAARPAIAAAAAQLGHDPAARSRPSDFAQALFDLGATICTSAAPACAICPLMAGCAGRRAGIAASLPIKAAKKPRPLRYGAHFWLTDAAGQVLLRRRPPRGLLGGMTELPGTPWRAEPWPVEEALAHAPMAADWRLAGQAAHGFTHFELAMDVYAAAVPCIDADGFLRPVASLAQEAIPTVMRKCIAAATLPPVPHCLASHPTQELDMVEPSQITEHMEVVGSDGQHVGTVDNLVIKLTKKDPASQGQHHIISMKDVASVDGGKLVLSMPASEAMQQEKTLS